ncbi:MAG TPA: HPr family phosphocarrier protein [Spirochaetota bacterium]|nr:HPr family phosphocarrier protein [Spirochaetota bacterium]HPH02839.1 HPr family phosphocarrier protein [Spirochaetota bacterium]
MVERTVVVRNYAGVHARPASMLAELASRFQSRVWLVKDEQQVECDSVLSVMQLAAVCDSTLIIRADGVDEEEAAHAFEQLISDGFGELEKV